MLIILTEAVVAVFGTADMEKTTNRMTQKESRAKLFRAAYTYTRDSSLKSPLGIASMTRTGLQTGKSKGDPFEVKTKEGKEP